MKYLVVIILTMLINSLAAVTIVVRQDGQGQFTSIQPAVTASVHGDTVLVYPGTYYENINYSSKNIMIASLELTTGNPAYRDSTIIDGNNNGSCVSVISNENNAGIFGFTLQHGSGTPYQSFSATLTSGGGIRIINGTNFNVVNCIVENNRASQGGGIYVKWGSAVLKGIVIRNNYASHAGGGVYVIVSGLTFNSMDRCSIYNNYAGFVNDIYCVDTHMVIDIYLIMATLNPTTDYYIKYIANSANYTEGFGIIDILQGYRTEVNHDLHLSPNGNDDNDGFTPNFPKKTIAKALHTIASDSLNQKTIYLAPGIYSSEDGQIFPLNLKAYVNLTGDVYSASILLNQSYEQTIYAGYAQNISISNLILEHGDNNPIRVFTISRSNNSELSNITINPVDAISFAGLIIQGSKCDINNIKLTGLTSIVNSGIVYSGSYGSIQNSSINNCRNTGGENDNMFSIFDVVYDSLLVIENLSITNCSDNFYDAPIFSISSYYADNPFLRMSNVLVANNSALQQVPIIIDNINTNTAIITNCIFVNNSGSGYAAKLYGKMIVSNCIFDNNTQNEISIGQILNTSSVMSFSNNLIRNYPNSVYIYPTNQITFNPFNFSADPSFAGTDWTDPLSYRLNYNSPCIDAGTTDTTGLYLPEFDLYGNLRIYNGIIDIGCNEWNGTGNEDEYSPDFYDNNFMIYPNPFVQETTLRYSVLKDTNVNISIYNVKGQLVKTLLRSKMKSGIFSTVWNGTDNNSKRVISGLYFIRIETGNTSITKKALLLK